MEKRNLVAKLKLIYYNVVDAAAVAEYAASEGNLMSQGHQTVYRPTVLALGNSAKLKHLDTIAMIVYYGRRMTDAEAAAGEEAM